MAEMAGGVSVPGMRPLEVPASRSPVRLLLTEALLTDLLACLAAAAGTAEVASACLPILAERPGVRAVAVARRSGRHAVILGSAGYDCLSMAAGAELPINAGLPLTEAIRTGRTVVYGSGPSWVAVPFGGGAAPRGALLLSLDCAAPTASADLARLHRLGRALGDALHRAASVECAQAQLAAVTAALQPASADQTDVVVRCSAADGQVAGDVVLCMPDGRDGRWLVVADVVGTGLLAGLVGRSVRAAVRTAGPSAAGPAALLAAVEHGIADDVPPGCFVTALAVHLGADGVLTAASAGHPPARRRRWAASRGRRRSGATAGPRDAESRHLPGDPRQRAGRVTAAAAHRRAGGAAHGGRRAAVRRHHARTRPAAGSPGGRRPAAGRCRCGRLVAGRRVGAPAAHALTCWVALLRGVNVGGHRRLGMAAWRQALQQRGADGVRTYLQSGNAVLRADGDRSHVGDVVRASVRDCGVDADVVLRTGEELCAVVARNPWPERAADGTQLHVGFLSAPGEGSVRRMSDEEEVRFDGEEVWIWYGAGAGRSRLVLDVGDRVLTARNWRSVTALAQLAAG